jgi:serine/threonine protein kinase
MDSPQPPLLIRFATFELDLRTRVLRRDGRSTGLPEQSITVLAMLLERPGELVLREEIRTKLWPNDTVVEFDHSINTAIGRLRLALGDSAENPHHIETLPRRGYRWIGPVVSLETREPIDPSLAVVAQPKSYLVSDSNLIGKKVSHYRVLEVLGGGGMGVVYKAEDLKLGRRVALKFLPEELASDSAARQRFESEARSASALNHPNICTVYGVEEYEDQPFLAMELLEGQTLRDLIATIPPGNPAFELAKLLDLAVQITAGLEAAHRQGIIHRDIKPANIFVTSQGLAKILDFGLAKLSLTGCASSGSPAANHRQDGNPDEPKREAESLTASTPSLSRTGVAMGTAGYMSPEQARGEKLDARTDLFSFGLVLYEMATGKRAFAGDTEPDLQRAILTQVPIPTRELNPALPAKLEQIINRALEKGREARYQSASEIHSELDSLRQETESRHQPRWRLITVAGIVLLLLAAAAFLVTRRSPQPSVGLPAIKLRQLTTNSSENRVTSGAISPNGEYLAYTDRVGMHLKLIKTGETRTIPEPDEFKRNSFEWQIGPGSWWFPDGTRFLAMLHPRGSGDDPNSQNSSIWVVSVLGGPPHKLRDTAYLDSISPDGSLIAFETSYGRLGNREIWVMQPDGGQARKVFDIAENGSIGGLQWSPDGQRVVYFKTVLKNGSAPPRWDESNTSFHVPMGDLSQTMVGSDLKGGPLTTILLPFDLTTAAESLWLPDGRMIYRLWEQGFNSSTCNLWQVRFAARASEIIGKPQRITNFPAVCATDFSITSDGKRLVFLESKQQASVYVADLQPGGTRIANPTRLTFDEGWNNPALWSADGKVVFFYSNRTANGNVTLFKQALGQDTAEDLFAGSENESLEGGACLSPDGSSILYGPVTDGHSESGKLMRVPISGGTPQAILTSEVYGGPSCARFPATLCAVAEHRAERKLLVFNAFDPANGQGPKLAEFVTNPTAIYEWRVSPDGTRIAILNEGETAIHILWLNGQPPQEIAVKGWQGISDLYWAADGKGFFVSSTKEQEPVVLYVDMQGNARLLWEVTGGTSTYAVPSPDDRHLAMQRMTIDGNMWMMENF